MARVTPRIYAEGRYTLNTPWAEVMPLGVVFVCEAIRTFAEIEEEGTDVYETYYLDYGVSESVFKSDLKEGACIITLVSQDRQTIIYVPDTFILYAPSDDAVNCDQIVLSVNLGVIPAYLDLTALKQALQTKMTEVIGIDKEFVENRVPSIKSISSADNDIATAAREAQMLYQESPAATIRALNQKIADLTTKLENAYDFMRANGDITTV